MIALATGIVPSVVTCNLQEIRNAASVVNQKLMEEEVVEVVEGLEGLEEEKISSLEMGIGTARNVGTCNLRSVIHVAVAEFSRMVLPVEPSKPTIIRQSQEIGIAHAVATFNLLATWPAASAMLQSLRMLS